MLDGLMRRLIDPPLDRAGRALARRGWSADAVTLAGLGLGLLAAGIVALGLPPVWAILPLLAGRFADGLDGAIARATRRTDFGGYLDITCDFLFYAAFPLAFVLRDPEVGAAGAFLLASFYVNGATFLGFAVLAARRGMETRARGEKSLYFTAGLLEGSETILFFLFLCLFPQLFAPAAWIFGALCFVTATSRVLLARRLFRE
ncbi:CDP-alcohol phosphatidyltransferase family protein [Cereibacter azotoformans]|uniref:Phosphatidylglycerophosphate synthase n=1 Tax=Cereibacter azotoformans TaxID=43057 RepID=A0A2T5KCX3_9RHOB|nr:CDP-alcohol phosphatidyltransferase family protein [Cereibacter azotoformans]AXQ93478.1 CDP-alcohol phosphatidyltransferase family protein [Cereibacter sphaeroides]MBO4168759.1 CDP-alcohol phosphatidyltransferase family protein [Cereibacter azotoformans]PTR20249.1 phosphatidylglycerophosphate synthase [Cereibacter azotoformans]UIJ31814.1 CDP-alcohol phosphatidyltransferase family protein [Cereibacter azotoformans]